MNDIGKTLAERGERYGEFAGHAKITQDIKALFKGHMQWRRLADDQKEALEMIAHKLGRIFNGDPNYDDSWVDIAGYAKLVADRLSGPQEPKLAEVKPAPGAEPEPDTVTDTGAFASKPTFLDKMLDQLQATLEGTCDCPGCTARRAEQGKSKSQGLTLDEIQALYPNAKVVIVSSSSSDTKH